MRQNNLDLFSRISWVRRLECKEQIKFQITNSQTRIVQETARTQIVPSRVHITLGIRRALKPFCPVFIGLCFINCMGYMTFNCKMVVINEFEGIWKDLIMD
jgi:hypothetical protein